MSNTSSLTPYDSSSSGSSGVATDTGLAAGIAVACVAGAVIGGAALAKWLSEETAQDRTVKEELKKARMKERLNDCLRPTEPPAILSVPLNIRNIESLVQSARRLGYQLESLNQPGRPLAQQSQVLLRSAAGERLAIERNARGRLVLHTAGKLPRLQSLVRQHTLDRAVEHLPKAGMTVRMARLANGEVQILAREQSTAQREGGTAEVKAQISTDGTLWVDVDKIRGNRCEQIVSKLAEAVGAEVVGTKKKDAFFTLPGEPTKTKIRI